jgi:hypothetical protein
MARGWESKSVEEQLADRQADGKSASHASMTEAGKQRQRQALELQREQILNERTSNPHRRAALQAALADIEEQLAQIS